MTWPDKTVTYWLKPLFYPHHDHKTHKIQQHLWMLLLVSLVLLSLCPFLLVLLFIVIITIVAVVTSLGWELMLLFLCLFLLALWPWLWFVLNIPALPTITTNMFEGPYIGVGVSLAFAGPWRMSTSPRSLKIERFRTVGAALWHRACRV